MYVKHARIGLLAIAQRLYTVALIYQFLLTQGASFHTHIFLFRFFFSSHLNKACVNATKPLRALLTSSVIFTAIAAFIHQLQPPDPLLSKRSIVIDFITQTPVTNRFLILFSDLFLGLVQLVSVTLLWDFLQQQKNDAEEEDVTNPFKNQLFILTISDLWERLTEPNTQGKRSSIPSTSQVDLSDSTLPLHSIPLQLRTPE